MLRRILIDISLAVVSLFAGFSAFAQSSGEFSAYSPYSVYGIGDMINQGTPFNRSMGGVGVASRNNRYINVLNPASMTERDTLSVMADVSGGSFNKLFKEGNIKSADNMVNITGINVSLPISYKYHIAAFAGIAPYSSTGYTCVANESDYSVIGKTGSISYTQNGQGSVYDVYAGLAWTLWKRLSIGVQYLYYFGYTNKSFTETFSSTEYSGLTDKYVMKLKSHNVKFGLQYDQPIGKKVKLCVGGTYSLSPKILGTSEHFVSASSLISDNIKHDIIYLENLDKAPRIAPELGTGIALNISDRIRLEFDYVRSDWTECNFETTPGFYVNGLNGKGFSSTVSDSFRAGFEITPNRNDIRYYYKKITYRAGAYYTRESFKVDGNQINSMGITLGATLPIYRWSNGFTAAVELGQRGSLKDNLIRERYVNVTVGINMYDIWFQKHQYH